MYNYFHRELLKRSFAMADETRIRVLKVEDRQARAHIRRYFINAVPKGNRMITVSRRFKESSIVTQTVKDPCYAAS